MRRTDQVRYILMRSPPNLKQAFKPQVITMAMNETYAAVEPARTEIDALSGPVLIEFGAPWCGFCLAAQPLLATAMSAYPGVRHIKIEDGPGRRLGRSFRVKLWPSLIFLRDGQEVARVVRPVDTTEIQHALTQLAASE
jgi:thioredoxin 1